MILFPKISFNTGIFEVIVGQPQAIVSNGERLKPSYKEGKIKALAYLYKLIISSSLGKIISIIFFKNLIYLLINQFHLFYYLFYRL